MNEILPDFGNAFLHTILVWCGLLTDTEDNGEYWQVWLIKDGKNIVGICGLYSLVPNSEKTELWLGWLALIPSYRNKGIGKTIMEHLYSVARHENVYTLLSYVDRNGKPLNFYRREGFEVIGTVKDYLEQRSEIDNGNFENPEDFIIRKALTKIKSTI